MWETWYKMSTMLQSGLNIDAVITHRFDIQDYEKGFAAMNSGTIRQSGAGLEFAAEGGKIMNKIEALQFYAQKSRILKKRVYLKAKVRSSRPNRHT